MPQAELLTHVDHNDNVLGLKPGAEFRGGKLIHRSVYLIIRNQNGEMLLQKRPDSKEWHPGLYSFSITGSVRDETYDECMQRGIHEDIPKPELNGRRHTMIKKAILIDFGGVVADGMPAWFHWLEVDSKNRTLVRDALDQGELGTISEAECFQKIGQVTGRDPEECRKRLLESYQLNQIAIELLQDCQRKQLPCFLVSNFMNGLLQEVLARLGAESYFTKTYISSVMRQAKPSLSYFQAVIDDIGLPASECLFIDNEERHAAGARSVGLRTIVYRSPKQLRDDLRANGVALEKS